MSPPLLVQAVDLARAVMMRHNSQHIHLSQAETELLAYGVLKQYSPADAYVKHMEEHNSGLIAVKEEKNIGNDDPHDFVSGQPHASKANERQVAGNHYGLSGLQHWDIVDMFGLGYFEGQVTKYIFRWRKKNGVEDLKKAAHFLEKLIEIETKKEVGRDSRA